MVDYESRERKLSLHSDSRVTVETAVEVGGDCNGDPGSPPPSERSTNEDDYDTLLGTMETVRSDHDESMGDTRRARKTKPRRPMTATRVSKIVKKRKRIAKESSRAEKNTPAVDVPQGLDTILVGLLSPLVGLLSPLVIPFLLLFVFLYLRFGEHNLFVDLTCFVFPIFFYLYPVNGVWRN